MYTGDLTLLAVTKQNRLKLINNAFFWGGGDLVSKLHVGKLLVNTRPPVDRYEDSNSALARALARPSSG